MALRTIRIQGDNVGTKVCRPIPEVTDRIRTLAEDMLETMYPVSLGQWMLLFASTHRMGEKLWDSLCSCTALLTHPSLLVQWLYLQRCIYIVPTDPGGIYGHCGDRGGAEKAVRRLQDREPGGLPTLPERSRREDHR